MDKPEIGGTETAASGASQTGARPMNGAEFLESLQDEREVWIYGQRVKNVTKHPAFRNAARMIARMYDALHAPATKAVLTDTTDTGNGGYTHRFYRVDRTLEQLVATRDAIAQWAKISYGWMGRSPDYKASFLGTLGANDEFYAPYQKSALNWYKKAQERVLFLNHAIVNPPIDRSRHPNEMADVFVHAEKETDSGIVVSGAKVVATGSALTHANFIGFYGGTPLGRPDMAIFAMIPMNTRGVKLICRTSYEATAEVMGSPFDYPLSSRLDENDAILVLDQVFIPWEDVFVYRDLDKANNFYPNSGFLHRFALHGCTRLAVKLDFLVGLLLKAVEATGLKEGRFTQMQVGEAFAWRNLFWGLTDAMARTPEAWRKGALLPNGEYASAYRILATIAYPRIKEIIEQTVSSGLIYLNSHAVDLKNPELRPYIDKYIRGSYGYSAEERIKVLKLLWDAIGSEFGGRHELYERNYAGNFENIRIETLLQATGLGRVDELKGFVDSCLNEYDVDGWKVSDLIDTRDVNRILDKEFFKG
ncbi:MAG TPA: 4-hydroxyphenylacetate 3-hydroxylase N-terminal domain-containing protein [Candidatus Binataceae bacterium]|nr:4-hydroxyphenylacetate 3-hydroxylase N-terminal domain-containing protein [Candidatus Binataceae bacterium]